MAVWSGLGDGVSWSDPNNWSPVGVPQSYQGVTIEAAGTAVSVSIAAGQTEAGNPLVLGASGTTEAVTLTNSGNFSNYGGVTVYAGATFDTIGTTTLSGDITVGAGGLAEVAAGGTIAVSGTVNVSGEVLVHGLLTSANGFTGAGAVVVDGGTVQTSAGGPVSIANASVAFTITDGGTLNVTPPPATVSFTFGKVGAGQTNTLIIPSYTNEFTGTINNFGAGDVISTGNGSSIGSITSNGSDYKVVIGGVTLDHVTLAAGMSAADITFANGGVAACYAQGTRILTPDGEMEIEQLAIGDAVVTASGAVRPIKWIGRRSYAGQFMAGNAQVTPVRIRAGALADGVPKRDLLVSPRHAMLIDGALVPAAMLVNGASILPADELDCVTYLHLELASHDVLLAEGAPSESFVDCDSRGIFHNAAEFAALYPDDDAPSWALCAPMLAEASEALAAIRQLLAARAGLDRACGPLSAWRGNLERADATGVRGWAFDAANPSERVRLSVSVDGVCVGHVLANRHRADLERAGHLGDGRHGFDFRLPVALEPGQEVAVHRVDDDAPVPGSPRRVAAEEGFDAAARTALMRRLRGVAAAGDGGVLADLTGFLLQEADALRLAQARLEGGARAEMEDPRDPWRGLAPVSDMSSAVQPLALVVVIGAPEPTALARMEALQELGFTVRRLAWRDPPGDATSHGGIEEMLRRLGDRLDVVLLEGAATAAAYGLLVRRFCPQARVLFGVTGAVAQPLEQALAERVAHRTLHGPEGMADAVGSVLRRWAA